MIIILVGILLMIIALGLIFFKEKTKHRLLFLGRLGIRLCIAALGLYLLNLIGEWADFRLAINPITVSVVAILGVPGVLSLALLTYLMV